MRRWYCARFEVVNCKVLFCFLFFLQAFTGSAMEKKADDEVSFIYDKEQKTLTVCKDSETYHFKVDEQKYNSIIETEYSWLLKNNTLPFDTQDFDINHFESLFIDESWSVITAPDSVYPVLVTSDVCECVAIGLISHQKIGMYHVYPENTDGAVANFVKDFTEEENFGETKAILVTGIISPNLSRCYEILQKTNMNIIVHALKAIQLTDKERIFHPDLLTEDDLMIMGKNYSLSSLPFAMLAIDARTLNISLNFNIEKFREESECIMVKALKAEKAGMYVKFYRSLVH